ncbi:ArsR/SmtB family transcription factor [Kitasatospora mediocidica]|uniref:ArsR/SmtB family transcription factor n=1 Tax=Kitasatospora mediocidica TaxID=58352 RepID=UPI0012F7FD32|nr:helix-turn-helix domain-containing protein [Kitasatospora mediocidica]
MIRVELGAQGLGRTRFAMSPLNTAQDLLFMLGRYPQEMDPRWRARAVEALRDRRLGLLAVLCGGGPHGYAPDFPRPEPATFQPSLDTDLHQVVGTPAERIRYELGAALGGHAWGEEDADRPPRLLLAALERGEDHLAQRVADELEQFWRLVLAPDWSDIRSRLEDDVTFRSGVVAREGLTPALERLAPDLLWREGGLEFTASSHEKCVAADTMVLVPSVFFTKPIFCAGEPDGSADPRPPLIVYPAIPSSRAAGPLSDELIGPTRAQLLVELSQPRSTVELARRLHLSSATVSYHLQILHRAGLLQRTRHSRSVLYQKLPDRTSA